MNKISPNTSVDQFLAYWFLKDSRVVVPLKNELIRLQSTGLKVYLATNQEHERAAFLMQNLKLSDCCDGIFYSAQLSVRKPNPEFFNRICSRTGLQPHELLLVDDTLANIHTASALGCETIHWTRETAPSAIQQALISSRGESRKYPSA